MIKKKMFLGIAALLFIGATAINVNLIQQSQNSNTLLESIAVMAQAQSEAEFEENCTPVWENLTCVVGNTTYANSIRK